MEGAEKLTNDTTRKEVKLKTNEQKGVNEERINEEYIKEKQGDDIDYISYNAISWSGKTPLG